MIAWALLIGAIAAEVFGTMSLRMAVKTSKYWYAGVVGGYVVAFLLLLGVLANGMALGVAYGIWAASGVALTAVLSRVFFKEPLTVVMSIGIALVVGGVLLVELGAAH